MTRSYMTMVPATATLKLAARTYSKQTRSVLLSVPYFPYPLCLLYGSTYLRVLSNFYTTPERPQPWPPYVASL